jgi:hypothetical protein
MTGRNDKLLGRFGKEENMQAENTLLVEIWINMEPVRWGQQVPNLNPIDLQTCLAILAGYD